MINTNLPDGFDIKKLSHLKTAGSIAKICFPKTSNEVMQAYLYAKENSLSVFPLGGGSNTLLGNVKKTLIISDLKYDWSWEYESSDCSKYKKIVLSSNHNINHVIVKACKVGLKGLDFLAGIPAHLGGLVAMNAGANGHEISENIEWIAVIDENGEKILSKKDIKFHYRKTNIDGFISKVCVNLQVMEDLTQIEKNLEQIKNIILNRKTKQPLNLPNLGCFFKNPENCSAGYLIQEAGLKSFKIGGAMVSSVHANFLVNYNNKATYKDFKMLIDYVIKKVYERFNVLLELEVRVLNG